MESEYDIPTGDIVSKIIDAKAKRVLIQLPDGIKPFADDIRVTVEKVLPDVELFFWGGSAFGSCDIPLTVERLGFDLIVHLGHEAWR